MEQYPALREKNRAVLPLVFAQRVPPSLFSQNVDDDKEQGGVLHRNVEQKRAAANLFDCQPSIQEVSNAPCESQGQRSQTPGVLLASDEGT